MENYHGLLISDCTNFILIGDGFCNDITNNVDCGFDGGDCCGSCVNTEHCIDCACLGNVTGLGVPNHMWLGEHSNPYEIEQSWDLIF